MIKEEFQAMDIQDQVSYINLKMKQGMTLTDACKSVNLTKELSRKYQRNGYKLIDMQFILQTHTAPSNKPTQTQEIATDIISTPKVKNVKKPIIGRPKRTTKFKKITTEIDFILYKQLKHYCIDNEINMNKYIEELLRKNLK